MAFTSLAYDNDTTMLDETTSMKPGLYHLNPPLITSTPYQTNPSIRLQKIGDSITNSENWRFFAGPIDQESDLFDITRKASKCPHNKYQSMCPDCYCLNQGVVCASGIIGGCNTQEQCEQKGLANMPDFTFNVEYTRLTSPLCAVKEQQLDRFDYLPTNPQNDVFFMGRASMNTREYIRDGYKKNIMCRRARRLQN